MKKLIICIIVLIAFISISILVESKLQQSANEILKDIDLLYNEISDENWDKVDKDLKKLENKWENTSDKWALLVEHEEIDQITVSFLKSKTFTINREKEEALAELREFKFMIDHIPKITKLELKNIL